MSLLEKASGGQKTKIAQAHGGTSLFSRAMAAAGESDAVPESWSELETFLSALPPLPDSILSVWSLLYSRLAIDAIALFLPQGDFLYLASHNGFPSHTAEALPVSLAPPSVKNGEFLAKEARALLVPILGVDISMELRATAMWAEVGLAGLWVYRDATLEASTPRVKARLTQLLASAAKNLPAFSIASAEIDPARRLVDCARKYRHVVAIRFDLASITMKDPAFSGLEPTALRSSLLSACQRILAEGGLALALGTSSVACLFGSTSAIDEELALFQFSKTLKRTLPFLSKAPIPKGQAKSFDVSGLALSEELSRFLSA